jgi:hypothetical protein
MTKITVECCGGNERYPGYCLKDRCPIYRKVKNKIDQSWPYVGTGYGNLYGNPSHSEYLTEVKSVMNKESKIKADEPNLEITEEEKEKLLEELGLTRTQTEKPSSWGHYPNRNDI